MTMMRKLRKFDKNKFSVSCTSDGIKNDKKYEKKMTLILMEDIGLYLKQMK